MALDIKSPEQLVTLQVNATQAASIPIIDFDIGSIVRAVIDGNMGIALYLQELFKKVEALTRLKTSEGQDKITFGADFNFNPAPSGFASTQQTFFRTSATTQGFIPNGAKVQTINGLSENGPIVFEVVADTTNPDYNPSLNGYNIPIAQFDIDVLMQCLTAGTVGNVTANALTVITSPINGISSTTNELPVTNGTNVVTGSAYDNAFYLYLSGLESGTVNAIKSAVSKIQSNIDVAVIEYKNFDLVPTAGVITIIVDDGSGDPSDDLIAQADAAVKITRAGGIHASTYKPIAVTVSVSLTITVPTGTDAAAITTTVQTAIANYFSGTLKIGISLPFSKIFKIVYDASPSLILDVSALLLNGAPADITAPQNTKLILAAPPVVTVINPPPD